MAPAVVLATPDRPRTTQQLIDWFERNFDCEVGPQRAYFYDTQDTRLIYTTYALQTKPSQDAEDQLVAAMYNRFSLLPPGKLYWRLNEKIELTEFDDGWFRSSQLDSYVPGYKYMRIYTRLVIPGAAQSGLPIKPEGGFAPELYKYRG